MDYFGPNIFNLLTTLSFWINKLLFFSASIAILNFLLARYIIKKYLQDFITKKSILSIFFNSYYFLMVFPCCIFYTYYNDKVLHYYIRSADFFKYSNLGLETSFFLIQSVPFFLLLGVMLSRKISFLIENKRPGGIVSIKLSESSYDRVKEKIDYFLIVMFVFSLCFLISLFFKYDYMPILGAIGLQNELTNEDVRFYVYNYSLFDIFVYAVLARFFLPFGFLYLFSQYTLRKEKKYAFLGLFMFLYTLAYSTVTLEKQFSIGVFALLILFMFFVYKSSLRSISRIILTLPICMAVFYFIALKQYAGKLGNANLFLKILEKFFGRIIADPSYMTYSIVNNFIDKPLLFLENIRIFSFLGYKYIHLTAIGFVADTFISFGWLGFMLYFIALGGFLVWIQYKISSSSILTKVAYSCILTLNMIWLIFCNAFPTMVLVCITLVLFSITLEQKAQKKLFEGHIADDGKVYL